MLTTFEHKWSNGKASIVVRDGKRLVLKARPVRVTGGYIIKGFGLCLLDKKPHPAAPNRAGYVNPQMMEARTLREVRRIINGIAH